jgi:chromosome segregation ATPase
MTDKKKLAEALPEIAPGKDEIASYRRSSRVEAPKQSNFNGLLVFTIVVMAILMGFGGYTLFEVQKKLDLSNQLLDSVQRNSRDIESELSATGSDIEKTFQLMKAQQSTNVSEIDKLWAIAFRQNRPKILELEKAILAANTANQKLETQLAQQSVTVQQTTAQFQALVTDIARVRQNLTDDNEDMTTQVSLVRSQVQDQADFVEANKRNLATLQNRVKTTEEAIDVIDKYRAQINKRLVDLKAMVQSTDTAPAPAPTAAAPL